VIPEGQETFQNRAETRAECCVVPLRKGSNDFARIFQFSGHFVLGFLSGLTLAVTGGEPAAGSPYMSTALLDHLWFHNIKSHIDGSVVNNLLPRQFTLQQSRIRDVADSINNDENECLT